MPHKYTEYRKPAPIYRERMAERRRMVEMEEKRRKAASSARAKRGKALCLTLAAALIVMCGMRIYISTAAAHNDAKIASLKEEIHELTMDAESYALRIEEAGSDENVESAAKQLGMAYPTDDQVRAIDD